MESHKFTNEKACEKQLHVPPEKLEERLQTYEDDDNPINRKNNAKIEFTHH